MLGPTTTPPIATPAGGSTPPLEDDEAWTSEGDSEDDDHHASTSLSKAKGKAHPKKAKFTVGGFGWKRSHREHPNGHGHHSKHKFTLNMGRRLMKKRRTKGRADHHEIHLLYPLLRHHHLGGCTT